MHRGHPVSLKDLVFESTERNLQKVRWHHHRLMEAVALLSMNRVSASSNTMGHEGGDERGHSYASSPSQNGRELGQIVWCTESWPYHAEQIHD